jgi:hypothetical protein
MEGRYLSEFELTSLALDLFRDMDTQIQFWLQATFAVIVVVFFVGDRVPAGTRNLIASLYLTASLLAAFRWTLTLRRNLAYRDRLIAEGYADFPTDLWLLVPVNLLITLMFVGGVLGTIYFLRKPSAGGVGSSR